MNVKILLGEQHTNTLKKSKELRYGTNCSSIRNSYELSTLVQEGNFTEAEILEKSANEGDTKEFKPTTLTLPANVVEIIDEICAKTRLSRAVVIRAIIMIQQDILNGTRSKSSTTITSTTLDKNTSVNATLSKIFYNFNDRGEFSPVMDVLSYWADDNGKDLEDPNSNAALAGLYAQIGWGNFRHFDVLNSLYKPYLCYGAVYDENPGRPLFMINKDEVLLDRASARVKQPEYIANIKKSFFAKNYVDYIKGDAKNIGNRHADRLEFYEKLVDDADLNELSKITYTLANFTPSPSDAFNAIKGIIASDSLPLFVDILQHGANDPATLIPYNKTLENRGLILTESLCIEFIEWLKENRSVAFLDDFFFVKEGKVVGIPMFPNQSLTHTIPANDFELSCFIRNTIARINSRAMRIAKFISSK